jgi:hypothetical protein
MIAAMPTFDGVSFLLGLGCGAFVLAALIGIVGFCWVASRWREEQRRLACTVTIRQQLQREVDELFNRRQALGLVTPPRIVPLAEVKKQRGIG